MEKSQGALVAELESLKQRMEELEAEEGLIEKKNETIASLKSEVASLKQSERERNFELAQVQEKLAAEARQKKEMAKELKETSERLSNISIELELANEAKAALTEELHLIQGTLSDKESEHQIVLKKSFNVFSASAHKKTNGGIIRTNRK